MSGTARHWLLDLGNSRLKCALLDERGVPGEVTAIDHRRPDAADRLRALLATETGVQRAWLASVAPSATADAIVALLGASGLPIERVRTRATCLGLRIAYPEPARLGVDRFLALLAASARSDGPWLLVSAGSALTVDLLQADGVHVGGLIAPMPAQSREMLARQFTQLDVPEGRVVDFADDTADAIASGANAAALGLVERSRRLAQARLGTPPTLLLAGGAAGLFDRLDPPALCLPSLVLEGLARFVAAQALD